MEPSDKIREWVWFGLVMSAVSCATAPAATGSYLPTPEEDKAVFLVNACHGMAVTQTGVQRPAALQDQHRWLLRAAELGSWKLEAYKADSSAYSAELTRRRWSFEPAGMGAFRLRAVSPSRPTLRLGASGALTLGSNEGCESVFRFEQFPQRSPFTHTVWVDSRTAVGGDGSGERPFRTIQGALEQAAPGWRILVRSGEYPEAIELPKKRSGSPDAWLVLESEFTHGARIRPPETAPAAFDLRADYVEFHGFDITSPGSGPCISLDGFSKHQRIVENFAHDCGGGGIVAARGDHRWIEGNIIARTSRRNRYQMSGISIWQPSATDHEPGFHNVVRRNISYANDNIQQGALAASDGNGIIIDDFRHTQFQSRNGPFSFPTLVEDNLVFGNGGSGIRVLLSDGVRVRHNTSYRNQQRVDETSWRGEIMNLHSSNNLFERNIAVADTSAHRENHALFEAGAGNQGVRWVLNLAYATPNALALHRREQGGSSTHDPSLHGVQPIFARPVLDAAADLTLVEARPPLADLSSYGARMELLPPLR